MLPFRSVHMSWIDAWRRDDGTGSIPDIRDAP